MESSSEHESLTTGERLDIVHSRLQEVTPSNRAMRQIAHVGDAVLRMVTTDFGDLFVSMEVPASETDGKRHYLFGSYAAGDWEPMSIETDDEDFARLVELAEIAEWNQEA